GVDRLLRRVEDVEQSLVSADLELLPRFLVDVRGSVDGEAFDAGRQRDRTGDPAPRPPDGLDDLPHRLVEKAVIVGLQADANLVVHDRRIFISGDGQARILATTPAPTVRPPSRTANLSPSSIAIGVIRSMLIFTLSPGITISVPSGNAATPVTSVVR